MKRKSEIFNMRQAISEYVSDLGFNEKFTEARIKDLWTEIMGQWVANRTTRLSLNHTTLYIKVDSAPLRNKLYYEKTVVIDRFNEKLGKEIIQEVVIR
jgi:hypothetical protein